MQMTATEITKSLTQVEYERLLTRLAGMLQTQRKFITIIGGEINGFTTRYKVKRKGEYYPYLIEETFGSCGKIYLNLGLVI